MQSAAEKHSQTVEHFMSQSKNRQVGRVGRVAIVSDSLPDRNGVGAYYRDLYEQFGEHGCKSVLLCPDGERDVVKIPLPGDSTQRIWIPSIRRFRKEMRALMPEAIVVGTPGPYGLLGAWWARRLKIPLIVGFHTHYSGVTDHYRNVFLRNFSRFYFNLADRILFRYADLVLGNSEGMVELAISLGAKRAEIMGTLLPAASLNNPVEPIRDKLERVIFAGRLAPEKRVAWVLETARELPDITFTIAGDGPLRDEVAAAAESTPNLEWVGWVSRADLLREMDRADLLVLPSVVESFGTVALEAMARGRLALVTPTCGIVDWPDLERRVFQVGETQSLADAIRAIAALPDSERRTMAEQARQAAVRLNQDSVSHWFSVLDVGQDSETAKENTNA